MHTWPSGGPTAAVQAISLTMLWFPAVVHLEGSPQHGQGHSEVPHHPTGCVCKCRTGGNEPPGPNGGVGGASWWPVSTKMVCRRHKAIRPSQTRLTAVFPLKSPRGIRHLLSGSPGGVPWSLAPGPFRRPAFLRCRAGGFLLRRKTKDETFRLLSSNQTAMSLPADRQVGAAADHGR